jgi:hypothetical protein
VAAADGTAAVLQTGSPPAPSGGPVAAATGDSAVPPGGSATIRVSAASPFDTINITIGTGSGFWQLKLPAPTTSVVIAYALNSAAPAAGSAPLSLGVQVVSPAGSAGPSVSQTLTSLPPASEPWSVRLGTPGNGLDVSACGIVVSGGFSSQVFHTGSAGGDFHEVWSPKTPVVEVNGTLSATAFSATLRCVGTGATGSMSATGSGQLTGTATLSGRTVSICVQKGLNAC